MRAPLHFGPLGLLLLSLGCESKDQGQPKASATVASRAELDDEDAKTVLAKVGERTITLGDYVSALERMDPFERLRYQTPERRKLLLDEMIEVELLAREAERRGLHERPETRAYINQLMREEVLRRLRDQQARPEQIPEAEVRAHYDAHPGDFEDPERRRVAVIVLANRKLAEEVLEEVRASDAKRWGELARERSLLASPERPSNESSRPPLELEGDLGLTTASGQERGQNPRVPPEVRDAVFEIDEPGDVYPEVVTAAGKHHVVRLVNVSPARKRSLEEAETVIRTKLAQQRIRQAEKELETELRKKYPVHIDENALSGLELPAPGPGRATVEPPPRIPPGPPSAASAAP